MANLVKHSTTQSRSQAPKVKPHHILIGGAVIAGAWFLLKAARAGKKLEATATGKILGLDGQFLNVLLDVVLTNPTNGRLRVKYPYIKLSVNGAKLADNQIKNRDINIPANSSVKAGKALGEPLLLRIPWQVALATLGAQIGQLVAGTLSELTIDIEVSTTAFAPGLPSGISQTITQSIPLKKPQAT